MFHFQIILSSLIVLFMLAVACIFLRRSMLGVAHGVLLALKSLIILSAVLYLRGRSGGHLEILLILSASCALILILYTVIFCTVHLRASRFGGTANAELESKLKH